MQQLRAAPSSLAFRANLATKLAEFKRVRPRVPFWQLASHRIPTLRLYRNLLRCASTDEDIRFRVCALFRQYQHITGPKATREQLLRGHKLLDMFSKAREGDEKSQHILHRYSRMIAAKREKERWKKAWRTELEWRKKMQSRPILTGTVVRASHSNKPFPRMRPQPVHISMIIKKRRLARVRRIDRYKLLSEWRKDMAMEQKFEMALAAETEKDGVELPNIYRHPAWDLHLKEGQDIIQESFNREEERAKTPIPPEMVAQVKEARREKFHNKARESQRERRGEVLNRTLRRRRKGPPAHILAVMTEKQKLWDKVSRSVSEVGYVATVKRKLGFKLRDPTSWKRELGPENKWEDLDKQEREIREENLRRRSADLASNLPPP